MSRIDREAMRRKVEPNTQLVKEWVVVVSAGTEHEGIFGEYWTYGEALRVVDLTSYEREQYDVMLRVIDGQLTTEFYALERPSH